MWVRSIFGEKKESQASRELEMDQNERRMKKVENQK